jgi:DNA-binding transcriptional LysR family regulator
VLGLAQSTVSETLLSLERVVGAPVTMRRRGEEATLTAAGIALLPHARALIAASEAALATVTLNSRRVIRLGAVESASSFLLPRALKAFRSDWPEVDVRITIGLCDELRRRVQQGELDAAITVEGANSAAPDAQSLSRALSPAQLRLFVSSRKTLGALRVKQRDLSRRPLLMPDSDGALYALMRGWFASLAEQPRFESAGSVDGVKVGVQSGEFVGVLPGYAVDREIARGEFLGIRVEEPLPALSLGLTTQRHLPEGSPLHDMVRRIEAAFATNAAATQRGTHHRARVARRSQT